MLVCTIREIDFSNFNKSGRSITHKIAIRRALGRVQRHDIGKRVYNVGTSSSPVYQVENDSQLKTRLDKEARLVKEDWMQCRLHQCPNCGDADVSSGICTSCLESETLMDDIALDRGDV